MNKKSNYAVVSPFVKSVCENKNKYICRRRQCFSNKMLRAINTLLAHDVILFMRYYDNNCYNQSAKSTDVFFSAQVVNVLRHEVITVYLHCCLAE